MKNIPLYDVRPISNLKDMLNSSADLYPSKAAFLVKPSEGAQYMPISYSQYKYDVDALGTALIQLGLKGKRIALISENRYEWAVSYLAVLNGVGIIVPLDKELPQNEVESLLIRSNVSAIIFSRNLNDKIAPLKQKLSSVEFYIHMDNPQDEDGVLSLQKLMSNGRTLLEQGDRRYVDEELDNEAMRILLFTSGTTEQAKAVMLSHRHIAANLMAMCTMLYIGEKDIFLSVLPIHHTYECTCGFLCPLYRGAAIAYCEGLRHIPKNLQESKATVMLGVPLIFEAMYRRIWDQASKKPGLEKKLRTGIRISNLLRKLNIDLTKKLFAPIHETFGGHIRILISGAAGIDPAVAQGFRELGIHLVQGYGLTECAPIVALNRDVDFKDSAAGLPLPGLQVEIDQPNAEGIGEIIVKGPNVMMGYYENAEATGKVLKDGWFYTGDLGYTDKDGFVYITGRKKNVIVTKNGKNIYPEEIETLLNKSPYIMESLIVGKDEEASGDTLISAIIVPDREKVQESTGDTAMTPDTLHDLIQNEIKAVNKSLVNYKHIKDFTIRDVEFAKTTTKKIKRYVEVGK